MSAARKIVRLEQPFRMHRGGRLTELTIAYETWGRLNDARDNAVLVFTGLSPSAHATSSPEDPSPGWWEEMIGAGRPIDTDRHHVICVNSLGSCYGSTGPASADSRGRRYGVAFPVLSIEDIARAGHELLRALRIVRLRAVAGPSMGGMSALAFAILFPDACGALVSLSSAARATPFAIALRSLQREMIRRDPDWRGGDYAAGEGPIQGMRLARKLGMITYRSAEEWQQRFGRERIPEERKPGDPFCIDFEIESYLESHAHKFTGQFDANCYLYLSRSMDLFDVAEHGGSVQAGLDRVRARRILVIGVETDILFPLHQQHELAEGLDGDGREVDFVPLPSLQGHDSFLVDMDRFRPEIARFFAGL
ncbi:MAG: homoserine O-acetyltransferase [Gammaproteobacteria bacterium]|nr:homoserine O-acetyltransferase [Gammaproteobacteria bacterium]